MGRETQRKGDIGVSHAITQFTEYGFDVSLPLTESAPYDLLVDSRDGVIHRVQVRYTSTGEVDLRNIHSNSSGYVVKKTGKGSYDWLFIYVENDADRLVTKCLHGRRSLTINSSVPDVREALNEYEDNG